MATKTQKSDPNQGKNATSYNLMIAVERHNGNPRLGLFDIESGAELELRAINSTIELVLRGGLL